MKTSITKMKRDFGARRSGNPGKPKGLAQVPARRRGIAILWMAIMLTLAIGLTGLGIDVARVTIVKQQLQAAADAAALAGIAKISQGTATVRTTAINMAGLNHADGTTVVLNDNPSNDSAGDVVLGWFDTSANTFTPSLTNVNSLKVVAKRTKDTSHNSALALLFGPLFGVNTVNVSRTAIAISSGKSPGLLVLQSTAPAAFTVGGNGNITINGSNIQVNSTNSMAAQLNGSITVNTTSLDLVGNYQIKGNGGFVAPIHTGVDPLADPLAALAAPTVTNNLGTVNLKNNQTATINPGYYPGGISASSNSSLVLNPGIYVVDGAGFQVTGGASLTANGVMIYITGTGILDLTSNGTVKLTPPNPNLYNYPGVSTYEGIAIFQARTNTQTGTITGTNTFDVEGTVYLPNAKLNLGGNGGILATEVLVNEVNIQGSGNLLINYTNNTRPGTTKPYLVQ